MNNLILGLVLLLAVCEWIAAGLRWVRVRQVTKPGTLLALLAWFTLTGRWEGPLVWFGLALVFSLAGDILLLLPYRYFLGGLAAFMIGHLFTIVGLNQQSPPGLPASALAVGATAVVVVPVLKRIQNGLVLTGRKRLRIPVFLYGVTIGLLLVSALWTLARAEWPRAAALMVSGGAALFVLSDALLAFHRFVHSVRFGNAVIMVSYHSGVFLLTAGALSMYA